MSVRQTIREWLRSEGGGRSTREIREALGLNAVQARGALREMVRAGVLRRDGPRGAATYSVLREPLSANERQRRSTVARVANAAQRKRVRVRKPGRVAVAAEMPAGTESRQPTQSVDDWLASGGRVQWLPMGAVSKSALRFDYSEAA